MLTFQLTEPARHRPHGLGSRHWLAAQGKKRDLLAHAAFTQKLTPHGASQQLS